MKAAVMIKSLVPYSGRDYSDYFILIKLSVATTLRFTTT